MTQDPNISASPAPESAFSEDDGTLALRSIILWSSAALGAIALVGLFFWSQTGSAVYFDRISGAIAGCF